MRSPPKPTLPRTWFRAAIALVALALVAACSAKQRAEPRAAPAPMGKPPAWVTHLDLDAEKLCGIGVAGAGFDERSPYPKQLARERAVRNLAGILETKVQEAIVDVETHRSASVELVRALHVDDELIAKIDALAEVEYWLDRDGVGPFAQKGFTYAHLCVETGQVAAALRLDAGRLAQTSKAEPARPRAVPSWIRRSGKQPGGRVCAVGFSQPMFFADKTFEAVVEDVRGQLAEVIETLVSSYTEELQTERAHLYEMMTVASTQALAKGVVVTEFWYDRDGRGPYAQARTTYGWGCVYPMDLVAQSLAAVAPKLPAKTVAEVRERAADAFEALDAEIDERERPVSPGPERREIETAGTPLP